MLRAIDTNNDIEVIFNHQLSRLQVLTTSSKAVRRLSIISRMHTTLVI